MAFPVVLSVAKDLIAACHGHEILRFAQDDKRTGRQRPNPPPHSNGEVSASYADGGVKLTRPTHDPSVAADGATSPFEWGGR